MFEDHRCEVSGNDLRRAVDDLRYDLERRIEDQSREIQRLNEQIRELWQCKASDPDAE